MGGAAAGMLIAEAAGMAGAASSTFSWITVFIFSELFGRLGELEAFLGGEAVVDLFCLRLGRLRGRFQNLVSSDNLVLDSSN